MSHRVIIVIAHNIRSVHNVGSILRSSDGFGVKRVILTGYTPYPKLPNDNRLPHISRKITDQIHKTALGAEQTLTIEHQHTPDLNSIKNDGYRLVGLEQAERSIALPDYEPTDKIALLLGEEVAGITPDLLHFCDDVLEIPMYGHKESFNVSVAAGIALYSLRMS